MTQTHDLLRGELERLFELDELTRLSHELMGYDPTSLGGSEGKGSFARALVQQAASDHALEALADAISLWGKRSESVARVFDVRVGRELEPGEDVAGFQIQKKIAEGGLGKVYLAQRTTDGGKERVALKVIRSSLSRDRSAVARFLTIQRGFRRMTVPGVAAIVECGQLDDGRPWVATEYIEGQTLDTRLQRVGPMHFNEARAIFEGVLSALQEIHDRGLVHSDVKSANTFIRRPQLEDGSRGEPTGILVDGGAYRLLTGGAQRPDALGALRVFGNAEAISPEMARGQAVDPGSDVYAVGVMLYEALTGRPPFQGESAFEVIAQHLAAEAVPPSEVAPKGWVSKELDALVLKALAKTQSERFGTAREFLEAMEVAARPKAETLDQSAFDSAKAALESAPGDEDKATELEKIIAPAQAWDKAIEIFRSCAGKVEEVADRKSLLFRVARLEASELRDRSAAEATYRSILELDEDDRIALSGIEELKRSAGDHEGLAELLLERAERIESADARAAVLREIAELYEDKLEDPDNALVAWTQALADDPTDEKTVRALERLAGNDANQWNEVLGSLNEAVQEPAQESDAVNLYCLMGRWYANQLKRPDFALPCYGQALQLDPQCDEAYEGTISLYRKAQSWQEYVQVMLSRAESEKNPAAARDYRAEAADAVLRKLGDTERAIGMLEEVLKDDKSHPKALDALEQIYTERKNWPSLAELLQERIKQTTGDQKVQSTLRLAELYEDRLDDFEKATVQYDAASVLDPQSLDALKGLERVYARTTNYPKLLSTLERELGLMATPRQKIAVLEHIGAIQEEEFVDHDAAIDAYEQVVEIDPGNENANPALARLYRQKNQFDDLVRTLQRHAGASEDTERKISLLMQAAKTLMGDIGAPDRALEVCERITALAPDHSQSLALIARIKAQSGDASEAVEAVDRLAQTESDTKKKAEHYVEAGRLLEKAGDNDRAIERYKQALDADDSNASATESLRRLYAGRGDAHGAADLLLRQIEVTDGKSKKAGLFAELGTLYVERLEDLHKAHGHFVTALELDPTCTPAARGLGDMAFAAENWSEATRFYEPLMARTSEMSEDDAREVALRCGDAFRAQEEFVKAQKAYENALAYAQDDRETLVRLAETSFDAGDSDKAARLFNQLLSKHSDQLAAGEKGELLFRLGDALRRAGKSADAVKRLDEASALLPDDPKPLTALRQVYESNEQWDKVVAVLRRRLDRSDDAEKFNLLVEIGDIQLKNLARRNDAAKTYVSALEITPDDRNLLTKLMGLYSESKDWARLVEVILRIAELVREPAQLAKYYITAASIAHVELKRHDEAADYYEQALEHDPTMKKAFEGLKDCLTQKKNWIGLVDAYGSQAQRIGKTASPEARAALWDAMGDVYRTKLEDSVKATEAYRQAHELDPESRERLEMLATIYETNPKKFYRQAVDVHGQLLKKNPYRIESYQALRQLYTNMKRPDESWCICQALKVLNMAGPDEQAFFKKHRSRHPAVAQEFLDESAWFNNVIHPDQDPLLTGIFAAITPAVVASRSKSLSAYKLDAGAKRNPEGDESEMVRTLHYVAGVTQIDLPDVYYRENDAGGLSILFTDPPSIGVGKGALAGGPAQALAFVAARQLSYFRPGHYLRHLVPSGSGLRGWLLAAIKMVTPQFPVPGSLKDRVEECLGSLKAHVDPTGKEQIRSLVQKLLAAAPELDMKRWVAAVDLTADRVGFVMANDLEISAALIKASPDEGLPQNDRLKELYLYSVGRPYTRLRQRLGIEIA